MSENTKKIEKARTSVTMKPEVLEAARAAVNLPEGKYKSVSALVELAIQNQLYDDAHGIVRTV